MWYLQFQLVWFKLSMSFVEDAVPGIVSAHNAGIGKIIAICPENKRDIFERMSEVYDIISNFHEFDFY